jgi:hypothetical protein
MPVGALSTVSHGNCARITPSRSQITKLCHLTVLGRDRTCNADATAAVLPVMCAPQNLSDHATQGGIVQWTDGTLRRVLRRCGNL